LWWVLRVVFVVVTSGLVVRFGAWNWKLSAMWGFLIARNFGKEKYRIQQEVLDLIKIDSRPFGIANHQEAS